MNIAGFRSKTHTVRTPHGDIRLSVAEMALSTPGFIIEMVKRVHRIPGGGTQSGAMVLTLRRDGKSVSSALVPVNSSLNDAVAAQERLIKEAKRLAGEEA